MLPLDKMVPIRLVGMAWFFLLLIYFLPNPWWGIAIKVFAAIFLVGVFKAAFSPRPHSFQNTYGPLIVLNTIWLAGILWFGDIAWLRLIFIFLIILGFSTTFSLIKKANNNIKDKS